MCVYYLFRWVFSLVSRSARFSCMLSDEFTMVRMYANVGEIWCFFFYHVKLCILCCLGFLILLKTQHVRDLFLKLISVYHNLFDMLSVSKQTEYTGFSWIIITDWTWIYPLARYVHSLILKSNTFNIQKQTIQNIKLKLYSNFLLNSSLFTNNNSLLNLNLVKWHKIKINYTY